MPSLRRSLLATSLLASGLAAPTNLTAYDEISNPLEARKVLDMTPLCNKYDPADWNKFFMNTFIPNEAPKLVHDMFSVKPAKPKTYELAVIDKIPGASLRQCAQASCDPIDFDTYCKKAPQWTWTLKAVVNYINHLNEIRSTFHDVVGPVGNKLGKIGANFNPSTKSALPDDSPLAKASAGIGLVGSVASAFPGWGAAAGTALDILSQVLDFFDSGSDANLEVEFKAYTDSADVVGTMEAALIKGLDDHIDNALSKNVPNDPNFANNPAQAPAAIKSGYFAAPPNYNRVNAMTFMQAALYAPAINAAWQREGVIIAKVNKRNLPIDPCVGNNLFTKDVAHCDKSGNMFVLQKGRIDMSKTFREDTPDNHKVPGWEKLGDYSLTSTEVIQSAWQNVVQNHGNGKGGGDPKDMAKRLVKPDAPPLKIQDVASFDLLVCDYDKNPWNKDTDPAMFRMFCGDYVEKNAMCYFYAYMYYLCPKQDWGKDKNGNAIKFPQM